MSYYNILSFRNIFDHVIWIRTDVVTTTTTTTTTTTSRPHHVHDHDHNHDTLLTITLYYLILFPFAHPISPYLPTPHNCFETTPLHHLHAPSVVAVAAAAVVAATAACSSGNTVTVLTGTYCVRASL